MEWIFRKMNENLHMQNATWLMSRELAEAAGPWDASLQYDQDWPEYYGCAGGNQVRGVFGSYLKAEYSTGPLVETASA